MSSEDLSRKEKLALAKQKLKSYQQRQKVEKQLTGPPYEADERQFHLNPLTASSESLAESSVSSPAYYNSDSRATEDWPRPKSTGFIHDEHRSPFQRVQRASESAEVQIFPTAAVNHSQDSTPRASSRPTFEDQTGYQPNFYVGNNEQTSNEASQGLRSEFGIAELSSLPPAVISSDQPADTIYQLMGNQLGTQVNVEEKQVPNVDSNENPNSYTDSKDEMLMLQRHNYELQSQIAALQNYCQELTTQLQNLQSHYNTLHNAYSTVTDSSQNQDVFTKDLMLKTEAMEKQIQQHLHTMSVLVDEKSELQSQYRQSLETANQKLAESEELKGRLKANRERMSALEKDVELLKQKLNERESLTERQLAEQQQAQKELLELREKLGLTQAEIRELSSRVRARSDEVDQLRHRNSELSNQLEMSQIYVRQITGGDVTQDANAVQRGMETLKLEKKKLESEVSALRDQYNRVLVDATQTRARYEAFVQQLTDAVNERTRVAEALQSSNLELQMQLEIYGKEVESLKDSATNSESNRLSEEQKDQYEQLLAAERDLFQQQIAQLNQVVSQQQNQLTDKDSLLNELREANESLNSRLSETSQNSVDTTTLLQSLQSERTTVSRAVAQNQTLKQQLTELQDQFVKMSQDNMDLSSKLQSFEFVSEQFQKQMSDKDEELDREKQFRLAESKTLLEQIGRLTREEFERSQLEDRLRHYESSYRTVQSELQTAKENEASLGNFNVELQRHVDLLKAEISRLNGLLVATSAESKTEDFSLQYAPSDEETEARRMLQETADHLREELKRLQARLDHVSRENEELHRMMDFNSEDENQNSIKVELQNSLDRINVLSNENRELHRLLDDQANRIRMLETQTPEPVVLNNSLSPETDDTRHSASVSGGDDRCSVCSEQNDQKRDTVSAEAFEQLKKAMDQLQDKVCRTMNENANLSEHNQQLEHLIVQLQGETDTVGEYITIYQHQRRQFRERLHEKDLYIAKLSRENEQMKTKLGELQVLVMKVLAEKGSLHSYPQTPVSHGHRPTASPQFSKHKSPRKLSETVVDETDGRVLTVNTYSSAQPESNALNHSPIFPISEQNGNGIEANGHVNGEATQYDQMMSKSPSVEVHNQGSDGSEFHRSNSVNSLEDEINANSASTATTNVAVRPEERGKSGGDDHIAERILNLLSELQHTADDLPAADRNLHCKCCRGQLQIL